MPILSARASQSRCGPWGQWVKAEISLARFFAYFFINEKSKSQPGSRAKAEKRQNVRGQDEKLNRH